MTESLKQPRTRPSALTLAPEVTDGELSALLALLGENRLTGRHLEIGTAAGGTLKALMLAYPAESRPPFSVVDSMAYFPDQFSIVQGNLRSAGIDPGTVDFRIGTSAEMLERARAVGDRFDFIFIDGNHKAGYVMQDLRWAALANPGGIVCLHDYGPKHPGVVWAADRFLRRNAGIYERISLTETLLAIRKRAESKPGEVTGTDLSIGSVLNVVHSLRRSLRKRLDRLNRTAPPARS